MSTIKLDVIENEVGPAAASDNGTVIDATAAEVREKIIKTLAKKKLDAVEKYTRIAHDVTTCLQRRGKFYFHSEYHDFPSAMYFDATDKVLTLIHSDRFKAWLSLWTAISRADGLFKFIMADIENIALSPSESSPIIPEQFWASRDGAIYLSCGDGQSVKISAKEIKLVDNGTDDVLFPCGGTMEPWELTTPRDPFETCTVFRDIACIAPHGVDLLRTWLISLPANPKTKPPLVVCGAVGSGKTRTCREIAGLYGIPERVTKVDKKMENDFWTGINQGGLFILDNADTKIDWLADAIAAAATFGGKENRRLYTDTETVVLRPRSWLAVTSATPTFASDAGLADRLLVVRMDRRQGTTADEELSSEVKAHRDTALSYFADTLHKALADKTDTPTALNSRHPDFARFAVRIGRAIGREPQIVAALQAAEADKARFCLENDFVGATLLATIPQEPFKGTAAQLLERLQKIDPDLREWSSKRLSKKLASHWPHIEGVFQASKQVAHGGALEYQLQAKEAIG